MPRKSTKKAVAKKSPTATVVPTKGSTASQITSLINQLRAEHQAHQEAIAEIVQTFSAYGIAFDGGKGKTRAAAKTSAPAKAGKATKGGRKAKPATKKEGAKTGGRGKFPITGDQVVLDFVKASGSVSTEDIRKHWQAIGRKGKADNNLTNLVKSNQLKRVKVDGQPGSRYELP